MVREGQMEGCGWPEWVRGGWVSGMQGLASRVPGCTKGLEETHEWLLAAGRSHAG